MKARLIRHSKRILDDGSIMEMKLWEVSVPVRGSNHTLKYSLYYGKDGVRNVAYDNEAGKGDHRHLKDMEEAYDFTTVEDLISDFLTEVRNFSNKEK